MKAPSEFLPSDPPDTRPGFYYVTAIRSSDRAVALLLGPFPTHAEALARVDEARDRATEIDPAHWWHAYGTVRSSEDLGGGALD